MQTNPHFLDGYEFVSIDKNNRSHLLALYELLENRKYKISHEIFPSYEDHVGFVESHPYRFWYLISYSGVYIGTAYILPNNAIGCFTSKEQSTAFPTAIRWLISHHQPLPPIRSVRSRNFHINIATDDFMSEEILLKLGARLIQKTFIISSI
jgi:hypothetical protein